jgi:hypothetical protein
LRSAIAETTAEAGDSNPGRKALRPGRIVAKPSIKPIPLTTTYTSNVALDIENASVQTRKKGQD